MKKVVAFSDLGMDAIHEFEVEDMPVTVAVDHRGDSVHVTGPREWQTKIGKIRLTKCRNIRNNYKYYKNQ